MKEIEEYERSNKNASSNVSELKEIDYHKSLQPAENNNQLSNQDKPKSLLKKYLTKNSQDKIIYGKKTEKSFDDITLKQFMRQ